MFFANRESGFILIIVMLFLLVLSLFAFSVLEVGLLENKMANFYRDRVDSFYAAEKKLVEIEQNLYGVSENVEEIKANICGVAFYRIKVDAEVRNARTCLESVFAKVGDIDSCDESDGGRSLESGVRPRRRSISSGRQSFSIIQ